ncbi:hypothetical protein [Thiohalobacter sp. COW1]|uniref:hypothetical protein n=1 Tax=Thiohalobacter sp. COW1 TaxID=2795687 RepID=UPI0019162E9B|nr:hypothetical protein [Thiohalobacter sp. COW1]
MIKQLESTPGTHGYAAWNKHVFIIAVRQGLHFGMWLTTHPADRMISGLGLIT